MLFSAARQAFDRWRLMPAPKRAEIIYRAGEILLERKEEYAQLMTREMGKVLKETRGDVQEAVDTAYYMAVKGVANSGRPFHRSFPTNLPWRCACRLASVE